MNLVDALTAVTMEATVNRTQFAPAAQPKQRHRWWSPQARRQAVPATRRR